MSFIKRTKRNENKPNNAENPKQSYVLFGQSSAINSAHNDPPYKFNSFVQHEACVKNSVLNSVSFSYCIDTDQCYYFATTSNNECTVYKCPKDYGLFIDLVFLDRDPKEIFYASAWSYDERTKGALLAFAGLNGTIRVVNLSHHKTTNKFSYHTNVIDLKFHQTQRHLLLSGSKDGSLCLWNIISSVCIAIFDNNSSEHVDGAISIDFDVRGKRIISGNINSTIYIWNIGTPDMQKQIEDSLKYVLSEETPTFPTIRVMPPEQSIIGPHNNSIDCVRWFGNLILSKSNENSIICWKVKPKKENPNGVRDAKASFITTFSYNDGETFTPKCIRFDLNMNQKLLAVGNLVGKIYIWELDETDAEKTRKSCLNNFFCNAPIRQVAFSLDAAILIGICEDNTIWRWNRKDV